MRIFYSLILLLLLPFALLRLFILGFKNPAYRQRWQERLGVFDWRNAELPVIWLHAVSVGEVNAATPVITKLIQQYPGYQLLITTVTPTGAQTLHMHFGDDIKHLYFPFDLSTIVKRTLDRIRPELLIIMETEIWPNLCFECQQRNIPVLLINARLSEKSAANYRRVGNFTRNTLRSISLVAAQTENDAERFVSLGMDKDNVRVTGNLKFDVSVPRSVSEQAEVLRRFFSNNRHIWMAASTQEGEEETVLDAHRMVLERHPDAVLILAPRHPDRCIRVAALCDDRSLSYVTRTSNLPFSPADQVFLLDTLGELPPHYAASQVAFVGGSLINRGGQNMLEPASLGIPVLAGPYTYNFVEATRLLKEAGGLRVVMSVADLGEQVCRFFENANLRHDSGENARQVIESNQGNVAKIMYIFAAFLKHRATYSENAI